LTIKPRTFDTAVLVIRAVSENSGACELKALHPLELPTGIKKLVVVIPINELPTFH